MCCLDDFILDLYEIVVGKKKYEDNNIVRRHSRKLEELGDLSFPLNVENWHGYLINAPIKKESVKRFGKIVENEQEIVDKSKQWHMKIKSYKLRGNDMHIFLERNTVYACMTKEVLLNQPKDFGTSEILQKRIEIVLEKNLKSEEIPQVDLSTLRMHILCEVSNNLINFCTKENARESLSIYLTLHNTKNSNVKILCGPILNDQNLKSSDTAETLYLKRSSDMQLMAQHKYGMRVELSPKWTMFFENLGQAAVTIEMLSNKPLKPSKVVLGDLRASNKGAAFIMYNCARLSALFRQFEKRVFEGKYPKLPELDSIDFSLLTQPEEWELMYVYILQFPLVIKSCVKDVEKGILNPQHLVTFLSNLSSIFSVYYRRVRILTDPREHMFALIHTRIYLMKALQSVYHNALRLLNIEPIQEM